MLGFENAHSAIKMIKNQIQSRSQGLLNFPGIEYDNKSGTKYNMCGAYLSNTKIKGHFKSLREDFCKVWVEIENFLEIFTCQIQQITVSQCPNITI